MKKALGSLATLAFLLTSTCVPDLPEKAPRSRSYNCRGIKTDAAWIVLEWNGTPQFGSWGSAFLADKEKGLFYTNKHVSDAFNVLGNGSQKLFFNCRVYNVETAKIHTLADMAIIRITDPFNPNEFPEPAPLAVLPPEAGDTVWIEGFHPHPYLVRASDVAEGFKFPLIPVFRDYYDVRPSDPEKERDLVFEILAAVVISADTMVEIQGQGAGITQKMRNLTNFYIAIKTLKDHKFSFGGLSGAVVRNQKRETLGIFTASPIYDEDRRPIPGGFIVKIVFKTAFVTPISRAEELRR